MGLWLLQECLTAWESQGRTYELGELLRRAAESVPLRSVVDAGDPEFIAPGRMPERIAEACRRTGQPVPRDAAETTRCVLDSLALAHRRALMDAQPLSGRTVEAVHIVGGCAHNELLCQLTADACGLPVVAARPRPRHSATSWCRPAVLAHPCPPSELDQAQRRLHVHGKGIAPDLGLGLHQRAERGIGPCVVDEDVEPAELPHSEIRARRQVRGIRDRTGAADRRDAGGGEPFHGHLHSRGVACGDADHRSRLAQGLRRGEADSPGGAGDQGRPSAECR